MKTRNYFALTMVLALSLGTYLPEAAAAPKAINSCQTITRSGAYELAKNLTASGDCIILAANFVTIDLAGFTITGDGTGIAVATDSLVNRRGYVVRHGMVSNFRRGVDFGNALDAVIEGIYAENSAEVGIGAGNSCTVIGNVVRGSGEIGIQAVDGSIVKGNVVIGTKKGSLNLGNGIVVTSGTIVSGNTSDFNAGHGIFATCPSNVTGNTAVQNGDGNIAINPATPTGCNLNDNVAP